MNLTKFQIADPDRLRAAVNAAAGTEVVDRFAILDPARMEAQINAYLAGPGLRASGPLSRGLDHSLWDLGELGAVLGPPAAPPVFVPATPVPPPEVERPVLIYFGQDEVLDASADAILPGLDRVSVDDVLARLAAEDGFIDREVDLSGSAAPSAAGAAAVLLLQSRGNVVLTQ